MLLYFDDWRSVVRRLDLTQRGELVTALMAFAETGELPEIADQMTAFAFDILSEKVARDAENYRLRCLKNAHATYCRECKKKGVESLPFDVWAQSDHHVISHDINGWEIETETKTEKEIGIGGGKGAGGGMRGSMGETCSLTPEEFEAKRRHEMEKLAMTL
jgi:hypothetical protein